MVTQVSINKMKEKIIILSLIFFSNFTFGQELNPLALVEKVFTDTTFIEGISKYYTGEYKGHPNCTDLKLGTKLKFKILEENNITAVINMTLTDSLGKGIDTYVHLVKENKWKIKAFRALAMTGFLEEIKNQFEAMTEEQIDTLIASGDENIKSKEDFYRELENIKLTLELDENIINHFEENQAEFNKIIRELLKANINEDDSVFRKINLDKEIKSNCKALLISSVSTSFYCENCFEFTIGGMIDNSVGYLYIPNKENVPQMNPSRLIMLREIGKGWYLFKTT